MNLPNKITVARLFLTIVIIALLAIPFDFFGFNFPKYEVNGIIVELNYLIAGVIFIIASLTDFLDGYLARKYNMVTDTGKILIVVDAIKMQAASKGKVVAAIKSGKWKTATMMIGTTLVFFYNMPFEFINIRVDLFLLYFACIMAVVSAVEYYVLNKNVIFEKEEIL